MVKINEKLLNKLILFVLLNCFVHKSTTNNFVAET